MKLFGLFLMTFLLAQPTFSNEKAPHYKKPELTKEQEACLQEKLGNPKDGQKLEREKMDEAFTACNIPKPKKAPRIPRK